MTNIPPSPVIRLELEHMKLTMMATLSAHHSSISEEVERQLDHVIETYPYEEVIQGLAHETLTAAITSYFKYGQGNRMLTELIYKGLDEMFKPSDSEKGND